MFIHRIIINKVMVAEFLSAICWEGRAAKKWLRYYWYSYASNGKELDIHICNGKIQSYK